MNRGKGGMPYLLLLAFLLLPMAHQAAQAGSVVDSLFQEANLAYSNGQFEKAIRLYEQITTEKGYSANILYNLAGSYARDGQTGKAILNYERALRLAPSDSDIRGNLEHLRKEQTLFPKEQGAVEQLFSLLNMQQWALLALTSLFVAAMLSALRFRVHFSKHQTALMNTAALLVFVLGIAGTYSNQRTFRTSIVIAPEVRLLISPFAGSSSVAAIQEGRRVFPVKNYQDYIYVVDETHRKGWLKRGSIEAICR